MRMQLFHHLLHLFCILLQSASVVAFTAPSSNLSTAVPLQSTTKTSLTLHSHAKMKEKVFQSETDEDQKNLSIALLSTRLYEILDLSFDELIDMEDLKVFLDSISTFFDTEGSIGSLCILMLSCLLLLNPLPAFAKDSEQGKDLTVFSYSRPNEIIEDFPKGFSNMCFNFPQENEIVDVFFGYARATNVDEDTCTFSAVSTMDDSTSVNVKSFHINNILNASGAALGFLCRQVYGRNNWIQSDLEEERKKAEAATSFDTPPESGSFQGVSFRKMSKDSSNKRMAIKRKLNFEPDGSIIGSGCDPIDGSFKIEGSWRKVGNGNEYKLRWKEMYDEDKVGWKWKRYGSSRMQDYHVEVEGKLFEGEEFSGRFKSSLNFTGYYLLKRSEQRIF